MFCDDDNASTDLIEWYECLVPLQQPVEMKFVPQPMSLLRQNSSFDVDMGDEKAREATDWED